MPISSPLLLRGYDSAWIWGTHSNHSTWWFEYPLRLYVYSWLLVLDLYILILSPTLGSHPLSCSYQRILPVLQLVTICFKDCSYLSTHHLPIFSLKNWFAYQNIYEFCQMRNGMSFFLSHYCLHKTLKIVAVTCNPSNTIRFSQFAIPT